LQDNIGFFKDNVNNYAGQTHLVLVTARAFLCGFRLVGTLAKGLFFGNLPLSGEPSLCLL
jgi:hypothetical protein